MSNERGFTTVEMLLAIVVLGVGIAGVMLAFSTAVRGSGDRDHVRAIAAVAALDLGRRLLQRGL